ncbi:hypothetical protein M3P05_12280 [Sansalvadorimonas sp. 2012CJ34-2]|uniref:Uncharacterized protein n=1 Tax=Parendozoicomonas callyspongiae TaxID=2942213 RepID=A0ABT0PI60_9GAMM|nr:hypothetical protein [Sansalvadorimonas sp. 2012CJ34-2]MCL6270701.1 hypothetical protein [Sansalvadorimonas sp. 2012CJ34-2]
MSRSSCSQKSTEISLTERVWLLVLLVFDMVWKAGMSDVPGWLRGTHWIGSYTGVGQGKTNVEVQAFNYAHFILRFYSRYGQRRFDGFYGGYINYDPVAGKLRFNPETDISWFSRL